MLGKRLWLATHKAAKVFKHYEGFNPRNDKQVSYRLTDLDIERLVGIYRKTKVPCSCYSCGNPRKYFGLLTMKEIRQHEEANEQYRELGLSVPKSNYFKYWS